MPRFSKTSLSRLEACHTDLQRLFNEVIKHVDCTVLCGRRGQEEQDALFQSGQSKLQYPHSKHNADPSCAVDVVPYPIDWEDLRRFDRFAAYVMGVADKMGIDIEWGGTWTDCPTDKVAKFYDAPHFQLKGK